MQSAQVSNQRRIAVDEKETAEAIGVSVHFLRKDRITKRLIPFYRIGGRVLYNLDRVTEALSEHEVGGTAGSRRQRARG